MWEERGCSDGSTHCVWLRSIAPTAAQLSSTGISNCDLPTHMPLGHLPIVISRTHPGTALQSLHLSFQPPWFLGTVSLSRVCTATARIADPCVTSPTHWVQIQSCSLSFFPPLSYILPSFIWIYTFLSGGQRLLATLSWCSARYSLPKVYSWCIQRERCPPHSPTLLPSCLSPSSRGSLVPLHFLPLEWYHLHIWGCWYFSWQSWFQLVIHQGWHFTWCTLCVS